MNREQIIRMAREAGWQYADGDSGYEPLFAFATLVAEQAKAEEREQCAKRLEAVGCDHCAENIRKRGQA